MAESPAADAWHDLDQPQAYEAWREQVLAWDDPGLEPIPVRDPGALQPDERRALGTRLSGAGFVCYRVDRTLSPDTLLALGTQLGLTRIDHHQCAEPDGVARLTARTDDAARFIPYTRQRLRWHTDGYYQPPAQQIRSFVLHCIRPAATGGDTRLLDPRLLYIALRDENPAWVAALSRPDAFTVPAHVDDGRERRPAFRGPVFAAEGRHLHMRYTERAQHIDWHPEVVPARTRLQDLLDSLPATRRTLRLEAGCGLIAHNVLHCRSAYTDAVAAPRLLYRIRYLDRAHADPE